MGRSAAPAPAVSHAAARHVRRELCRRRLRPRLPRRRRDVRVGVRRRERRKRAALHRVLGADALSWRWFAGKRPGRARAGGRGAAAPAGVAQIIGRPAGGRAQPLADRGVADVRDRPAAAARLAGLGPEICAALRRQPHPAAALLAHARRRRAREGVVAVGDRTRDHAAPGARAAAAAGGAAARARRVGAARARRLRARAHAVQLLGAGRRAPAERGLRRFCVRYDGPRARGCARWRLAIDAHRAGGATRRPCARVGSWCGRRSGLRRRRGARTPPPRRAEQRRRAPLLCRGAAAAPPPPVSAPSHRAEEAVPLRAAAPPVHREIKTGSVRLVDAAQLGD